MHENEQEQDISVENIIMKYLYTDKVIREKVMPFLDVDMFDINENIVLMKFINKFMSKYNKFPSPKETKLKLPNAEAFAHLQDILRYDTTEYTKDVLLDTISDHIKNKMILDICFNIVEKAQLNNFDELSMVPDEIRTALSFDFDDTVGLDVLSLDTTEEFYEHLHNVNGTTVSTGLSTLDELLDGGFESKTLSVFMGGTNVGKSVTMCAMASNNIKAGKNVLYVSCEMAEHKVGLRVLQNVVGYSKKELRMMTKDKLVARVNEAKAKLSGKFIVKQFPTGQCNVNHIRNLLKELKIKKDFSPDIVYLDYLGIMASASNYRSDNTYTLQKRISEEVRGLSCEVDVPFVSAVQTNRSGIGQETLSLTNIADSFGIGATIDNLLGIVQTKEMKILNQYKFELIKARDTVNGTEVYVGINYDHMELYDLEVEQDIVEPPVVIKEIKPKQMDKKTDIVQKKNKIKF